MFYAKEEEEEKERRSPLHFQSALIDTHSHLLGSFSLQHALHALQSEVIRAGHDGQVGGDSQFGVLLLVFESRHDGLALRKTNTSADTVSMTQHRHETTMHSSDSLQSVWL